MKHALVIGICTLLGWTFPVSLGPAMIVSIVAYIFYSLRSPESRCRRLFIKLMLIMFAVPSIVTLVPKLIPYILPEEFQQPLLNFFVAIGNPFEKYSGFTYFAVVLAFVLALVELIVERKKMEPLKNKKITFSLTLPKRNDINLLANSKISGIEGSQVSAKFELTLRNESDTPYSFDYHKFIFSWPPFYTENTKITCSLTGDATLSRGVIKIDSNTTTSKIDLHVNTNAKHIMAYAKLPRILWAQPKLDYQPSEELV